MSEQEQDAVIGKAVRRLREAETELATLQAKAKEVGSRFERLGGALSRNSNSVIIGPEDRMLSNPQMWQTFSKDPLPTIDEVLKLTDSIRQVALNVERLKSEARSLGL